MTISSEIRKVGPFAGNNTTTVFPFDFKVFKAEDLLVIWFDEATGVEQTLTLNSDYSATLNTDQNANPGGSIKLSLPLPTAHTLTITSELPYLQQTDLTNQGGFYPSVITNALDRLTIFVQQLRERVGRALVAPISDGPLNMVLPGKAVRARKYLSFDETGRPVVTTFDIDEVQNAANSALVSATKAKASEINAAASASAAAGSAAFAEEQAQYVGKQVAAATPSVVRFSGDDVETRFELPSIPGSENNTQVYIGGVYQQKDTYEVQDDWLIFSESPPMGVENIEVMIAPSVQISTGRAQDISYVGPDGVTYNLGDLAKPSGAKLIGFTGPDGVTYNLGDLADPEKGAGMIATVSGKTVQQSLSDLGTVVSRMPASSDDFPSLQDALNSGETVITIPNGNYVFDSQINVSSHSLSSIRGDGNVVLDFSNLIGGVGLEVDGGLVEISPPTISPKAGSNKIIFPSNTALSKGDIVILWNPEDFSLNKYRNYYRDGFMAKIAKVDESGEVTIFGPVPRCNLSSVRAFKFSTTNPFSIEGLKIIPPQGGTGVAIRCRSSVYLSQSLSASDGGYAGIELDRCFDVKIDVTSAYSNYEDAYPIILSNSQNFFINGYNGRSTKHSIGVGGGSALGSVPVRDGIVSNCILENDGISGIGAADSHGNAVNISYNNCIIKSAANIGGRDIRFKSCTIYARSGILDGSTIYGAEVSGGVFSFTDITCVMDNAVVHGFPVIEVFCRFPTDDIYLHIDNIVIKGEGVTSTDRPTEALIRLALSPTEFTYSFYVDIGTVHCMNGIRLKNLFHIASTQEGTTTVPFAKSAITVSSPIPNSFDELIFMGVDDFSGNITKYLREPTIIP